MKLWLRYFAHAIVKWFKLFSESPVNWTYPTWGMLHLKMCFMMNYDLNHLIVFISSCVYKTCEIFIRFLCLHKTGSFVIVSKSMWQMKTDCLRGGHVAFPLVFATVILIHWNVGKPAQLFTLISAALVKPSWKFSSTSTVCHYVGAFFFVFCFLFQLCPESSLSDADVCVLCFQTA